MMPTAMFHTFQPVIVGTKQGHFVIRMAFFELKQGTLTSKTRFLLIRLFDSKDIRGRGDKALRLASNSGAFHIALSPRLRWSLMYVERTRALINFRMMRYQWGGLIIQVNLLNIIYVG